MGKAVIPMDSCFGKSITASYTISNLNESFLTLSIPAEPNGSTFMAFPGDPILFSYDINYNLATSILSTTKTSLYISLGYSGTFTTPLFNKVLLRITNLPKILYTGTNTSISFSIYFYYGYKLVLLRSIQLLKGQNTGSNDGNNTFLIEIDNIGNLSINSLEEAYRVMIPKNWIGPRLTTTTTISSSVITNTNFDIYIPRSYTFPNYIAGDILHQLVTSSGEVFPNASTNKFYTTLILHFDEEIGIPNRDIANYFRFIKLTLEGFPSFVKTTDISSTFFLYLKLGEETTTLTLSSKLSSNIKHDFNGTYYVDLKTMSIISEEMFNKALI